MRSRGGAVTLTPMNLTNQCADYIATLRLGEGSRTGECFQLLPWQKEFLGAVCDENNDRLGLSIARGNGKSTFLAAILACAFEGPLSRDGTELYCVAASLSQARVVFKHLRFFLGNKVEDRTKYNLNDSTMSAHIRDKARGITVTCLAGKPETAHGRAPSLVVCDEPAQWDANSSEAMLAALDTGLGKQELSKLIAIGTRPRDSSHWFQVLLNGQCDHSQNYHVEELEDGPDDYLFDPQVWLNANPSLPHLPTLARKIEKEAQWAKLDPMELAKFKALRLNMGTDEVDRTHLIQPELWKRIEGNAPATGPCIWGVDLGTSAAMCAISCYWLETGRLDTLCAFPTKPSLAERGMGDGVGDAYVRMKEQGNLIQTGGFATDVDELLLYAVETFGKPVGISCDSWRRAELTDHLMSCGLNNIQIETRSSGFGEGSEDIRAFRRHCLSDKVTPVKSLLLRSAMSEAVTIIGEMGEKLSKSSHSGRRARARDDAAAAAILAVAWAARTHVKRTNAKRFRYASSQYQ